MAEMKLRAVSVLGILAGLLIFVDAVSWALAASSRGMSAVELVFFQGLWPSAAALVIVASLLLWLRPSLRVSLGLIVLLCALFSTVVVGDVGLVGVVLGIVAGILAVLLQPAAALPSSARPQASPPP